MMIREQEDILFEEWREKYKNQKIVKDGVISEDDYLSSKIKILLILKEVNDEGGGGWDLREFVAKGARSQTWNLVSLWIKGLQEIDSSHHWEDIKKVKKADRLKYLKSIAVMNLKKTPGKGSSKKKEILNIAEQDKGLLNRQFDIYKPDIVICCGTGSITKEVLTTCKNIEWNKTSRGVTYGKFSENQHIFHFYHPQSRYPNSFKYYMLLDAIKEVRGLPISTF